MPEFIVEHSWLLLVILLVIGLIILAVWLIRKASKLRYTSNVKRYTTYGRANDGWWNESKGGPDPYDK